MTLNYVIVCLAWLRKLVHFRMMSTSNVDINVMNTSIVDVRHDAMLCLGAIATVEIID
jgi:hypothetical protein